MYLLVCQIDNNSIENLIQFWYRTVENVTNDYEDNDCTFLKETIKNKIYSDVVVLLHYNDDWKTLLMAVRRFSKCQINHSVINFSARNKNLPSIRCCNSTSTLVFTTSKIATNIEQVLFLIRKKIDNQKIFAAFLEFHFE